jgi:hypothetical protein
MKEFISGDIIAISHHSECHHIFHKNCAASWLAAGSSEYRCGRNNYTNNNTNNNNNTCACCRRQYLKTNSWNELRKATTQLTRSKLLWWQQPLQQPQQPQAVQAVQGNDHHCDTVDDDVLPVTANPLGEDGEDGSNINNKDSTSASSMKNKNNNNNERNKQQQQQQVQQQQPVVKSAFIIHFVLNFLVENYPILGNEMREHPEKADAVLDCILHLARKKYPDNRNTSANNNTKSKSKTITTSTTTTKTAPSSRTTGTSTTTIRTTTGTITTTATIVDGDDGNKTITTTKTTTTNISDDNDDDGDYCYGSRIENEEGTASLSTAFDEDEARYVLDFVLSDLESLHSLDIMEWY